jgi:hypothetical protein
VRTFHSVTHQKSQARVSGGSGGEKIMRAIGIILLSLAVLGISPAFAGVPEAGVYRLRGCATLIQRCSTSAHGTFCTSPSSDNSYFWIEDSSEVRITAVAPDSRSVEVAIRDSRGTLWLDNWSQYVGRIGTKPNERFVRKFIFQPSGRHQLRFGYIKTRPKESFPDGSWRIVEDEYEFQTRQCGLGSRY